jgi:tetraacyldisaccharide 4'-kinase
MSARGADRRPFLERLWRGPILRPLIPVWGALAAASLAYESVLAARARYWKTRSARAPIPIISVGNLTVGGNGKTPFALYLANLLRARGWRIAILSRGFGGRLSRRGRAAMVADGGRIFVSVADAGDEPVMMAHRFAGPIAIARRRIDGTRLLAAHGVLDAIILDDGFQHLRLARDLDLVLIDESRGFGNGWVLPAGPMREPAGALARADAIVYVQRPGEAPSRRLIAAAPRGIPTFRARLCPRAFIQSDGGGWREAPLDLAGRRVAAVSGLADPAGFRRTLEAEGAIVAANLAFPDHHEYSDADLGAIADAARNAGASAVIVTMKDLVKIERFAATPAPLYALELGVALEPGDEERLLALAEARLRGKCAAHQDQSDERNGGCFNGD